MINYNGPGIYYIINLISSELYIGSSIKISDRCKSHFYQLRKGNHHSIYLQRSFNFHGEENFDFCEIERVIDVKNLISREQFWINTFQPSFNMSLIAGSNLGYKFDDAYKAKMSQVLKSKNSDPLWLERLRRQAQQYKNDPIVKRKISIAVSGKLSPEEARDRGRKRLITAKRNDLGRFI